MLSEKVLTKVTAIPGYLQNILPIVRNLTEAGTTLAEAKAGQVEAKTHFSTSSRQKLALTKSQSRANRDFSFSGSGFLAAFHLGAASSLIQKGILTKRSKLAGASGGALIGKCQPTSNLKMEICC